MEATCPSPSLPDPRLARAIQARALGWAQVQMWEKVKCGAGRLKLSPEEFKTVSAHPLTGGIKLRPHGDMEAPLTAFGGVPSRDSDSWQQWGCQLPPRGCFENLWGLLYD